MDKLTLDQKLKAHGERLAENFSGSYSGNEFGDPMGEAFSRGYTAAAEVFRLAGRIEATREIGEVYVSPEKAHYAIHKKIADKLEAQLAAMLSGESPAKPSREGVK